MSDNTDKFSNLFINNAAGHKRSELRKSQGMESEHPFQCLDKYLTSEHEGIIFKNFDEGFEVFMQAKQDLAASMDRFQFEISLLQDHRSKYLNAVVGILLKYIEDIESNLKDGFVGFFPNELKLCLLTLIKTTLKDIFIGYHLELSNSHHSTLSKWFFLKEPVRSFVWKHFPNNERLWKLYEEYLIKPGFVSSPSLTYKKSFQTFKGLFEGKVLEDKVNWIGSKSSLYYFIRLLKDKEVIRNPKNNHWIITSEYFLLKGETLTPEDFHNQKETQNKEQRKALEYFVSHLIQ
ncbi:hypothetical protein [Robiginitalea marina]|uniref:Uncharacterized protein n=1 Tax=Robiginitalea marina TaxID=2954105 RepID=A0ABT1AZS7_9FLAO|nr:hypothetical protein [Robiginitalea marina]MCO5725554.1 hypothetical protein [Robiginitalea marina]